MGRLHGVMDERDDLRCYLTGVHIVAQRGAEGNEGTGGIVLAAVESPVDKGLDAAAERLEEGGDICRVFTIQV